MSSLTAQESSEANPSNPVNPGTTAAAGTGSDTAAGGFSGGAKNGTGSGSGKVRLLSFLDMGKLVERRMERDGGQDRERRREIEREIMLMRDLG
jgi:hypothetical protein